MAIIGLTPLPNLLARQLYVTPQWAPSDCMILLGGGVLSGGQLSTASLERTTAAAIFYRKGLAPKIIISTGVTGKKAPYFSEAKAMQETLLELGIPQEAIVLEERSTRTAENAREVAQLMKEMGFKDGLLVTSSIHMKRALLCFRRYDLPLRAAPVGSALEDAHSFTPRILLFDAVFHEYAGILYYRLRGWV